MMLGFQIVLATGKSALPWDPGGTAGCEYHPNGGTGSCLGSCREEFCQTTQCWSMVGKIAIGKKMLHNIGVQG